MDCIANFNFFFLFPDDDDDDEISIHPRLQLKRKFLNSSSRIATNRQQRRPDSNFNDSSGSLFLVLNNFFFKKLAFIRHSPGWRPPGSRILLQVMIILIR